jgi:hypothetical protein
MSKQKLVTWEDLSIFNTPVRSSLDFDITTTRLEFRYHCPRENTEPAKPVEKPKWPDFFTSFGDDADNLRAEFKKLKADPEKFNKFIADRLDPGTPFPFRLKLGQFLSYGCDAKYNSNSNTLFTPKSRCLCAFCSVVNME